MSQPVGTQNFLIHDANGKPQVIKVVHTTGPTSKVWRSSQSPQVRTSAGLIRSVGGPVKQLYNDDDSDSASSSYTSTSTARHKGQGQTQSRNSNANATFSSPSPTYKVYRRSNDNVQSYQTYQVQSSPENDSIQMGSEHGSGHGSVSGSRLSSVVRRVATSTASATAYPRATPTPVKRISPEPDFLADTGYSGKRRRAEKGGKGLRHFSMKVCQKVRQKGKTTYNEVADELVAEFTGCAFQPSMEQNFEQKNIRRRVYDALNVLMAMNIIYKEKKEIRWLGLPSGFPKLKSTRDLEAEERNARQRIAHKKKTLQDLILQQVAFKNLVERNREVEKVRGPPAQTATIQLPMLVVSTNQDTTINCSVSNDRREYFFSFDDVFEIKDESHVLQGMGMMMGLNTGDATPEHLIRAKTMIPRALAPYLEEMVRDNVGGEASMAMAASGSMMMSDRDYEDDEEGTVYLEEDDSATDDDMEAH